MHLSTAAIAVSALAALASCAPALPRAFTIPSDDGYPSPNPQQLRVIQETADGSLSNAPPPAKLGASTITAFQLIAFNEHFETAFFSSLVANVTNHVPGFEMVSSAKKTELLDILETVLAQEKLHAINAVNALKKQNAFAPSPCKYRFPTTDIISAIALAEKFTAVVLGTLQDAGQTMARNGDFGPVRGLASSLGQEGQQSGFYRILLSKKPSEKPFLTTSVAAFAYSSLVQQFIVPDSCDYSLSDIALPIFPSLKVLSGNGGDDVEGRDQHLTFSADLSGIEKVTKFVGGKGDGLWITYFTGQLLPISVPIVNAKWHGNVVTFEAEFPFSENIMEGLSIASLTIGGKFANPVEVVDATLAAPGLIQVDDRTKSWDGYKL